MRVDGDDGDDDNDEDDCNDDINLTSFKEELMVWALLYGISLMALKELLKLLRKKAEFRHGLPKDPRTLVKTNATKINVEKLGEGKYWHQGLENCLRCNFSDLIKPLNISLNISMDGLP